MRKLSFIMVWTLCFQCLGQKSVSCIVGSHQEFIKVVDYQDFNVFDDWEIVDREWVEDCDKSLYIGDTLANGRVIFEKDLHLGELVSFSKSSVSTSASFLDLNMNRINYRIKGYWSVHEYSISQSHIDCQGDYFLRKYGENQLVVEIGYGNPNAPFTLEYYKHEFNPVVSYIKDGFASRVLFVLNRNLMAFVENGTVTYLKRRNKKPIPKR